MATSNDILGLVRSHSTGDAARFRTIALQIAAGAARAGRGVFAEQIKALVEGPRAEATDRKPLPREVAGLVQVRVPDVRLDDVILPDGLRGTLERVLAEHAARDRLSAAGLKPRRKLLLSGPSGTGKTMTATALAAEMDLPLHIVRHDAIITKFMGESAAKLRLVFDAIATHPAVWLFDEFDAFAADRGMENDVGEARRMLNSILQMIEEDAGPGLILAATNHIRLLDKAIFRRFDIRLDYAMPESGIARRVMSGAVPAFTLDGIDWRKIDDAARGLSQANLVASIQDAARSAVLYGDGTIDTAMVLEAVSSASDRYGAIQPENQKGTS